VLLLYKRVRDLNDLALLLPREMYERAGEMGRLGD
jgi:hypothetical protein